MNKRIIVINGHSVKDSFCESIAKEYIKGAKEKGAQIKKINLYDLDFDPIIRIGRQSKKKQILEKDLKKAQEDIKWATHIVFTFPIWWGDVPALMKGFMDRILIPGFAYDPRNKKMGMPKALLAGKTSRVFITMGAPSLIYKIFLGKRASKIIKSNLSYCGIKSKITPFYKIDESSKDERKKILEKVYKLALKQQ